MSIDMYTSETGRLDEHERLRMYLEGVRERAATAVTWRPELIEPFSPSGTEAPTRRTDTSFHASARQEVSALAEFCLTLLDLHRPRDAGGISSAPAAAMRRCNCCMLRWPCPTVQEMSQLLK
ncbi:hypothetical protein [Nocardiopsis ansamitocini]|uniref:Uncharacterized protein n=1 Tax=Nocardiopsis ansamitocini TaxID=1670832 RepID=A0A9W6P384_9ACTN|nr:hypothetical protein [Nocardiopsis ansamitocini]GLU46454.1 hypothetical protein Nans01_08050 [Nocardiopsis ansamitocini]